MTPDACRQHGHDRFAGVRANIRADVGRYLTMSPENIERGSGFKQRLSAFLRPELLCLTMHRIAHYLHVRGWRRSARLVTRINALLHKVHLTPQSCIGPGCRLPHPSGLAFHGRAGTGLTLFSTCVCCPAGPIVDGPLEVAPCLGDDVTVGGHAVLIGPIEIGDRVKISFSARVAEDVPSDVVVISRSVRNRVVPNGTGSENVAIEGAV